MKTVSKIFKKIISIIAKLIIAVLLGVMASLGHKPVKDEKKDNKSIELDK
jgi:hypothetical protein